MIALFDHEEVGSASTSGAAGPILEQVLERLSIADGLGPRRPPRPARRVVVRVGRRTPTPCTRTTSSATNPTTGRWSTRGPAIKINSNQRYATTSATEPRCCSGCSTAPACRGSVFVSRNNMPCGSTIGPITATRLGIATVDVGVPQLSMHSARELCGADDPIWLATGLQAYLLA